jgi:hypothetical protein
MIIEIGELWIYRRWTHSGVELCTPILLGEASKKIWEANHFQKNFKTHNGHIPQQNST